MESHSNRLFFFFFFKVHSSALTAIKNPYVFPLLAFYLFFFFFLSPFFSFPFDTSNNNRSDNRDFSSTQTPSSRLKFNRVIFILNCTLLSGHVLSREPINAGDNYFCGWTRNECTISKYLSRANEFFRSFLSFFLSFFPHVSETNICTRIV